MDRSEFLSKNPALRQWQETYRYPEYWRELHHVEHNLLLPKEERWALGDLLNKRLQFSNYREPVFRAFTAVVDRYEFQPPHKFNLFEAFSVAHKIHRILDEAEQYCLESDCLTIQQAACRALTSDRPLNLVRTVADSIRVINSLCPNDYWSSQKPESKLKLVVDNTKG